MDLAPLGALLRALAEGRSESAYPCAGVAAGLVGTTLHIRTTHAELQDACPRRTFDLSVLPQADRPRAAKQWLTENVVSFATSVREAKAPKPRSDADWWAAT